MIGSIARHLLAVSLVLAGVLRSLPAQGVPPESLLVQLRSPDWLVRSDALARLSVLPPGSRPTGYADAIVALLDKETTTPDTAASGEGGGEYMIQVIDAALGLRDPRTLRGMAVWGTQISRVARDFMAEQGSAALPYLDEAWNSVYSNRDFIVITWARMLGTYRNRLTNSEQVSVLRSILNADSLALIEGVTRVPLPEALPAVEGIAASTRRSILRVSATEAAAALRPLRAALGPTQLVQQLADVLGALCLGAQGARSSACTSLSATLSRASALLAANQPGPADDALTAFAARVDAGAQQGIWSDREHRLLAANARYVGLRLSNAIFLHADGGHPGPPGPRHRPALSLSTLAPSERAAKSQDSPRIKFAGGNSWVAVGTWTAAPGLGSGTLTALGAAQLWLGLKDSHNSDTYFDLRVEAYKNGALLATGQTLCVQGITGAPDAARNVTVAFAPVAATSFNGISDVLALRVLTRIGTTAAGTACGGHPDAAGVRVYFDGVGRAAGFAATF